MRITNKHHKNSQLHALPDKDSGLKPKAVLDCPCKPVIEIINGHLIVQHNMVGKGADRWSCKTVNLGIKYKL